MDVRHQKRIDLVKILFPLGFKDSDIDPINKENIIIKNIIKNIKKIDETIIKYAPKYPIEKISKIDLAILRLSVYEMIFENKNPYKVIINEAIELAKEYGNEKSYSFINGVLGSLINKFNSKK